MADDFIPEDVRQFILLHIDSVAQMEGLLMFRADAQKVWDAQAMARVLFISESEAEALLVQLLNKGFIIAAGNAPAEHYQYIAESSEHGAMVERAAGFYQRYLVPMTNLIHSKPKTRIQKFADAFKLRKD